MGGERGDISSTAQAENAQSLGICLTPSFTQLFLSPKNVSSWIIPCIPLYQGELESMSSQHSEMWEEYQLCVGTGNQTKPQKNIPQMDEEPHTCLVC